MARWQNVRGWLVGAGGALLLVAALAAPAAAGRPADRMTLTTLVSANEATCEFTVRYDWSGFGGNRLLAEILLYEHENGIDRPFAGGDKFIVEGKQGTFTWTSAGVGFSTPEPGHPLFAEGSLWTYSNNTKYIEGSRSFSDSVYTDCDF